MRNLWAEGIATLIKGVLGTDVPVPTKFQYNCTMWPMKMAGGSWKLEAHYQRLNEVCLEHPGGKDPDLHFIILYCERAVGIHQFLSSFGFEGI